MVLDTDAAVIATWLADKRPETQRVYAPVVAAFQQALKKPLSQATGAEARAWLAQWQHQEAATRARKIRTLRSLYRFGQAHAGWHINPFLTLSDPVVPDHLRRRLPSPEDVWTLLAAAQKAGPRRTALVSFVFGTGCRVHELVVATWGSIVPAGGEWFWRVPDRTPTITPPLRPEVVTALQQWRAAQQLAPTWDLEDPTPLFPDAQGHPSRPVTLTATIRRLTIKAGLPHAIPAFGLRHAHTGFALEHGASLRLVQRSLGHHQITSTARYLTVIDRPESSADFPPWKRT